MLILILINRFPQFGDRRVRHARSRRRALLHRQVNEDKSVLILWEAEEEEREEDKAVLILREVEEEMEVLILFFILFFIGSQLVSTSGKGKVGVWHAMTQNFQIQVGRYAVDVVVVAVVIVV